LLKLLVLVFF